MQIYSLFMELLHLKACVENKDIFYLKRMKYEIANEFGVNLGPDTTSRANGSVGGEITKRLVRLGQNQISGSNYQNK